MSLANSDAAYGGVAKFFHWTIFLLMLTVIPLGVIAHGMEITPETLGLKATLFSAHKTVGLAIFFTALARIVWAITQPKPAPLHPDQKVQHFLAEMVHWLLYGSLVLVPLTGWIHHAATAGYAPIWWPFGQGLPLVPQDEGIAALFAGLHMTFERVLIISIFLHVAGALKHHVLDKDDTLRRMLPGKPVATVPPKASTSGSKVLPIAGALVAWALAVGVGSTLGVYSKGSQAAQVAELAEVETGWAVQEGTLGITVQQFGSPVSGSFADWTAAITFDETADADGTHGSVEVTIAIGSLTLGSVTDQALGADFFDAGGFPTATFAATLLPSDTGYVADGTLTMKGTEIAVSLPFTLDITDGVATMSGSTTLDRRDFGVGAGYSDESTVGFSVDVAVELVANQS